MTKLAWGLLAAIVVVSLIVLFLLPSPTQEPKFEQVSQFPGSHSLPSIRSLINPK